MGADGTPVETPPEPPGTRPYRARTAAIVSTPLAVAGVAVLLFGAGVSQSALPLVPLFARGGALVFAGASLVVAGHTASTAFQMGLMSSQLRRHDMILYLGWFLWAGGATSRWETRLRPPG